MTHYIDFSPLGLIFLSLLIPLSLLLSPLYLLPTTRQSPPLENFKNYALQIFPCLLPFKGYSYLRSVHICMIVRINYNPFFHSYASQTYPLHNCQREILALKLCSLKPFSRNHHL